VHPPGVNVPAYRPATRYEKKAAATVANAVSFAKSLVEGSRVEVGIGSGIEDELESEVEGGKDHRIEDDEDGDKDHGAAEENQGALDMEGIVAYAPSNNNNTRGTLVYDLEYMLVHKKIGRGALV
jgi:hypothetical protein